MQIDDTPVLTDYGLILAETSTHSLRFYNRTTGALIRAVGQKGEGPGDSGISACCTTPTDCGFCSA